MSEELIATIAVSIIGSQALLEVVKAIIQAIKTKKRKPTSIEEALQWLMWDRIEHIVGKEIEKGETDFRTKSFIRRGSKIFHELFGNGDLKQLLEDYEEIPVKYSNKEINDYGYTKSL